MKRTTSTTSRQAITLILLFWAVQAASCSDESQPSGSPEGSDAEDGGGTAEQGTDAAANGETHHLDGSVTNPAVQPLDAATHEPRNDAHVAMSEYDADSTTSEQGAETTSATTHFDAGMQLPDVEIPEGSVPSELANIWQQTLASFGDYVDQFGNELSATSGFSSQLKITADGRYYFAHYAGGVSPTCASVNHYEQSVGSAVLDGETLTLTPVARRIDVNDCENSTSVDAELEPIVLTVSLTEDRLFTSGYRYYTMHAEGYLHPFDFHSLFRLPTFEPEQPGQPADFTLGEDPPYEQLQGFWVADEGTDFNFYNPETNEYYFPELNGSSHQWLRFDGANYETAVALQNVNLGGVCKLDFIYYERGSSRFAVLEDVGGQGSHFVGHTAFEADDIRLIANIRECDEDDGASIYELSPLTSYFRWIYFSPENPPESFSLVCDFPRSEWQTFICDTGTVGFQRL